jgi:hypothetical protein
MAKTKTATKIKTATKATARKTADIFPRGCVPEGVPELFRAVYAPAEYIETLNRPGQRLYATQWEMQNGEGVSVESQMNALYYCTRPRVLIPRKRT